MAQNGRSCIRRKMTKIVYPNLHVDIGCLANWCFKHLPQVRSSPAHFCGELRRGIKFNQFSTQKHWRMFPRIAYKEIKIDKILQDLPFFTVLPSRALARGFPNMSMERNPLNLLELVPLITTRVIG